MARDGGEGRGTIRTRPAPVAAAVRARAAAIALSGLLWLGGPATAAMPDIRFEGNEVLIDEVYRAVLDLPRGAAADEATARLVERQIQDFLHHCGYELARVEARPEGRAIRVVIDEGRLDKIVFTGVGSLKTLQFKLDLDMPHHVFNRIYLERQLEELRKRYGIAPPSYRLVTVRDVPHRGPQIRRLGRFLGQEIIPPGSKTSLFIRLGGQEWDTGLGLDLQYDFPDGLELGVAYRGVGLLVGHDRWLASGVLGGKLRDDLSGGDTYAVLSHAGAELRWYTPPFIRRLLRAFLSLQSDLVSRQRKDLNLEIFYREFLDATLHLSFEWRRRIGISLGGGMREKFLFGLEPAASADPVPLEAGNLAEPFIIGRAEFWFNPQEERRDRRRRLQLEARHHWVDGSEPFGRVSIQGQWLWPFGYHDLWVKARGALLYGAVQADDEEPVGGRYLRGVFGDRYYAREAAGISAEFRLSLARDLFKLSLFHDLSLFGSIERATDSETPRVANSFGLGFHALILDVIQFDIYSAFGFTSEEGDFDYGLAASLSKVF